MDIDKRLFQDSGPVNGPFTGVSVYAPFVMLMHTLLEDVLDGGSFGLLLQEKTPFTLEAVPNSSLVRLTTKGGSELDWTDLYRYLQNDSELDTEFKKIYNMSFSRATVGRYDYDSEFLRLTAKHVEKGSITDDDVVDLNNALLDEFSAPLNGVDSLGTFLVFCHLTVNRINRGYFETRPALDSENDNYQRWYLWSYLGMMTLINRLSLGKNGDNYQPTENVDIFLGQFTATALYKKYTTIPMGDQIFNRTVDYIRDFMSDSLKADISSLANAVRYSTIYNVLIDIYGSVGSREAYQKVYGQAEYDLYTYALSGIEEFIEYVRGGETAKGSTALQPSQDWMDKIQSVLSKAIFLDGQNRAEFVKSELGDLEDLSNAIGDDAAQLIFDILDGLNADEQKRLGKSAKKKPKANPVQVAAPSEFDGCELVEVEDDDLDLDDELDDLLEDLFDDEELDDLLDIDLEDL